MPLTLLYDGCGPTLVDSRYASSSGSVSRSLAYRLAMDQSQDTFDTESWKAFGGTLPTLSSSTTTTPVSKYSPSHYQRGSIEVWDFIVDQKLDYLSGNVVKYICRAGHKSYESELDDWLKVKAYVERKIKALSQDRNR